MDYAKSTCIFRKVLIISRKNAQPAASVRDEIRFRRFAAILSEAGFSTLHCYVSSIPHLSDFIDRFKPDLVFSCPDHLPSQTSSFFAHSSARADSVNVHEWLEMKGIPFVGSSSSVIELALSKTLLKGRWIADGVSTPQFLSIDAKKDLRRLDTLEFPPMPCIVKPADAGNSRGISADSVVFDIESLHRAARKVAKDFRHIMIEHYLGRYPDFREITCACVGNGENRLIMPAEITFVEPRQLHVITTEDKDGHATEAIPVAEPELLARATIFARSAFDSAGVRDYSRCDMAFADGKLWAIEVNGQPMIPDPWFEACARVAGLSERQYILAIFLASAKRIAGQACLDDVVPPGVFAALPGDLAERMR